MKNENNSRKVNLDENIKIYLNASQFPKHEVILNNILAQIGKVNFENRVIETTDDHENESISDSQKNETQRQLENNKPKLHHYLVLITEEILRIANEGNYGICKLQNEIYLYNGAYWKKIDKELFQEFLGEATLKMGVTKYKAKFFQFKEYLFKQFMSDAYRPTANTDKDVVKINLLNGTYIISVSGCKLVQFRREDALLYQLSFSYNQNSIAPIFDKYLNRVLPDKSQQMVLAEYIGYLFIKNGSKAIKEEKVLILYGSGANGKSVFFEIINALLGKENITNYPLQNLTDSKGYHRAKIANVLLNYASEISGKMEANVFKQMASGEPIDARLPFGEPFTLDQYAKLIFNCNELPKDVEHSNAFFRRFLIIYFSQTIPAHEQDKELHTKIIENELSGVFNWALEGLNRLLFQKGFTKCEAVEQAREEYKIQSDSILTFLQEENYQPSLTYSKSLKELYREYTFFCVDNGYRACGNKLFRKRLEDAGYGSDRNAQGRLIYIEKINN